MPILYYIIKIYSTRHPSKKSILHPSGILRMLGHFHQSLKPQLPPKRQGSNYYRPEFSYKIIYKIKIIPKSQFALN